MATHHLDRYEPDLNSGCWLWTGSVHPRCGHGTLYDDGRKLYAHRFFYEALTGRQIPEGLCVCHRCNTPACVNPSHLYIATNKQNLIDAHRDGLITGPRNPAKGSRIPWAKLTPDAVRAIRASSEGPAAAGRRFGVSPSTINDVRRPGDRRWSHVV